MEVIGIIIGVLLILLLVIKVITSIIKMIKIASSGMEDWPIPSGNDNDKSIAEQVRDGIALSDIEHGRSPGNWGTADYYK